MAARVACDAVLSGIAAFALQVAGGGDAGNKEWRHDYTFFFEERLAPPFGFAYGVLHPCNKAGLARVAQHVQIGFRHNVADGLRHVGTKVHILRDFDSQ